MLCSYALIITKGRKETRGRYKVGREKNKTEKGTGIEKEKKETEGEGNRKEKRQEETGIGKQE